MSLSMPTDDPHRRRKRVKRRETGSSVSHSKSRNHDPALSKEPESSERPTTVEDLRKARLTYLASPQEERQRRMRYEYVKTVKVKETDKTEPARDGSTATRTNSTSKSERRTSRSKPKQSSEKTPEEDDDQYVYRSSHMGEHVPGAFVSQQGDNEVPTEKSKNRSRSTKVARPGSERRRSAPVLSSRTVKEDVSTSAPSRPPLRKSTTRVSDRPRSTPRLDSTPVIPEDESATGVASPSTKKSGSIFGGFFAPKPQPVERKVSCLTCGDDVLPSRTAKLPCTHRMCHSCLKRIFKLSITDPAQMPPRCCTEQPISLKHVDALFDDAFKKTYNRKFKEHTTQNKIYCPARGCGEWIQPKHIKMDKGRKIGKCPTCKTQVCATCSQKMHRTRECPKDPATKAFVEAAQKAGWQKCYNCSAMVELKEGCNHMTCRCTAEFCMMCGLKWKSCDCPWFTYDQVDGLGGDPMRFQQEMDRRREQEDRDEAIARRINALQDDDEEQFAAGWFNLGNAAGRHMNEDFINQAREALTANFAHGDGAARELLGGLFQEREHRRPAMPGAWDDGPQQFQQTPPRRNHRNNIHPIDPADFEVAQPDTVDVEEIPIRRRTHRRRDTIQIPGIFEGRPLTDAEREQQRQIRAWATGGRED